MWYLKIPYSSHMSTSFSCFREVFSFRTTERFPVIPLWSPWSKASNTSCNGLAVLVWLGHLYQTQLQQYNNHSLSRAHCYLCEAKQTNIHAHSVPTPDHWKHHYQEKDSYFSSTVPISDNNYQQLGASFVPPSSIATDQQRLRDERSHQSPHPNAPPKWRADRSPARNPRTPMNSDATISTSIVLQGTQWHSCDPTRRIHKQEWSCQFVRPPDGSKLNVLHSFIRYDMTQHWL